MHSDPAQSADQMRAALVERDERIQTMVDEIERLRDELAKRGSPFCAINDHLWLDPDADETHCRVCGELRVKSTRPAHLHD